VRLLARRYLPSKPSAPRAIRRRDRTPGVTDLRANIARVRETIAESAVRGGRAAEAVTLVAASKTVPPELIAEARSL
jgi:hypothetical protein